MPVKPLPISTRHCTSAMKSLLYVTSLLLCVAAAIASSPSPGLRPLSEVMEMLYFHIPASNVTHFVASDREVTPLPWHASHSICLTWPRVHRCGPSTWRRPRLSDSRRFGPTLRKAHVLRAAVWCFAVCHHHLLTACWDGAGLCQSHHCQCDSLGKPSAVESVARHGA